MGKRERMRAVRDMGSGNLGVIFVKFVGNLIRGRGRTWGSCKFRLCVCILALETRFHSCFSAGAIFETCLARLL